MKQTFNSRKQNLSMWNKLLYNTIFIINFELILLLLIGFC